MARNTAPEVPEVKEQTTEFIPPVAEQVAEIKAAAPTQAPAMTVEQMLEVIARLNSSQTDRLAEAIVAAQKPYVDPRHAENEELFRKQTREQELARKASEKAIQDSCPHIAGCNPLSEFPDPSGRTSIVWHRTDTGEVVGLCTYCQRPFREGDPDYSQWRMKKSFNRESKSGDRYFADPVAARKAARA